MTPAVTTSLQAAFRTLLESTLPLCVCSLSLLRTYCVSGACWAFDKMAQGPLVSGRLTLSRGDNK